MPRRPNPAPPKRWHKHAMQWYVYLGGKFFYLGRDEAAAEVERRRLIAERLTAPAGAPPGPAVTVAAALERYWQHAERYYEPSALGRVRRAMRAVLDLYERLPVKDFDQTHLEAVRQKLLASPRETGEGLLSRNYVNSVIGCVQTAWMWLASQKVVSAANAAELRTVRRIKKRKGGRETARVRPPDPAHVAAALAELERTLPCVAAMCRVQQYTGMRPGEVCLMRRGEVSINRFEKVEAAGVVVSAFDVENQRLWVYAPSRHKTERYERARVIVLGPRAQAVLLSHMGKPPGAYLFSPREAAAQWNARRRAHRQTPRTPSSEARAAAHRKRPPGEHYTPDSYRNAVLRACKRAGVPPWKPNQLRHLAATRGDEAAGRDATAAMLGHTTPDQTAVYAEQALRKAALLALEIG